MSDDNEDLIQTPEAILESLKARADRLGLKYHPSIGVEKLREKVSEALAGVPAEQAPQDQAKDQADPVAVVGAVAAPVEETLGQKRKRMKLEATRLVRIRVTCMNPAKKDWDGEIITTGNALVGTIAKFVPYNGVEWHVPFMLYQQLRDRQCQIFYTEKSKHGVAVRKGKLIKEFAIDLLEQLTPEELHDLAQRQAMAQSVG